ncbi:MAG: DUF6145 family protein [Lachnospiraceae bacterium]
MDMYDENNQREYQADTVENNSKSENFDYEKEVNRVVLCAANSYEQKFYLNPKFNNLPAGIQDELKIMCVVYTEDVGGILSIEYEEDGSLIFISKASDMDFLYDEISAGLKIRQFQQERQELLEALELYYRLFFMHNVQEN